MPEFSRHFTSQKLGRASGTVRLTDPDTGTVTICPEGNITPTTLTFRLTPFLISEGEVNNELILRRAIAQLHRFLSNPAGEPETALRSDLAPWIGDLNEVPVGGGTLGYQRSAAQERRELHGCLNRSVEQGVLLHQSKGRPAARIFLQSENVPPSVIRRVLSNSVARRKA
jgi:hypothetical protein